MQDAVQSGPVGTPLAWNVGDVVLGRYQVKEVHAGGMGLVYRVWDSDRGLDLAVKSPGERILESDAQVENVGREFMSWIRLGVHPNIVKCFHVRNIGGILRIFIEYVHGGLLSEWIRQRQLYEGGPNKALQRILDIAIQFAWGLGYAHDKDVIHADVKPSNVMMTPEGVAKVTDFGLARCAASLEALFASLHGQTGPSTSTPLYTREYASPEQVAGEHLTRATDIWSWGVSVLEMFAGAMPPYGPAAPELLHNYLEDGIDDESMPVMPAGVANLLRRCVMLNPQDRPGCMTAIAASLRTVYQDIVGEPFLREEPNIRGELRDAVEKLDNAIRRCVVVKETAEGCLDQEIVLPVLRQVLREAPTIDVVAYVLALCNAMKSHGDDNVFIMRSLWTIVGLVLEFGEASPVSLKVKARVPTYFEEAIKMIADRRGTLGR